MTKSSHHQKFASNSTTRRPAKFAYNIFQDDLELAEIPNDFESTKTHLYTHLIEFVICKLCVEYRMKCFIMGFMRQALEKGIAKLGYFDQVSLSKVKSVLSYFRNKRQNIKCMFLFEIVFTISFLFGSITRLICNSHVQVQVKSSKIDVRTEISRY